MATTWTNPAPGVFKTACTTGTESAPTLVTEGFDISGWRGFGIHLDAAGAMTAGNTLKVYMRNKYTGTWAECVDLTQAINVTAVTDQYFQGFTVPCDTGRIAVIPSGLGVAVDAYIFAVYTTPGFPPAV